MEPEKTNTNEVSEEVVSESTQNQGTMDVVHHHMNKSVVSRIIVVVISLILAMALGYVLYSQLLSQTAVVDESQPEQNNTEVVPSFDMSTFDPESTESRRALLEYINSKDEPGQGEETIEMTMEDRQNLLSDIAKEDDEVEEFEELTIEDRMELLKSIPASEEEVEPSITEEDINN